MNAAACLGRRLPFGAGWRARALASLLALAHRVMRADVRTGSPRGSQTPQLLLLSSPIVVCVLCSAGGLLDAQPQFRSPQEFVAGNVAIADGRSHPLSQVFQSLQDAQSEYRFAVSLHDELAWAAITLADQAGNVVLPAGVYIVNRPLRPSAGRRWRGAGEETIIRAGMNGWSNTDRYGTDVLLKIESRSAVRIERLVLDGACSERMPEIRLDMLATVGDSSDVTFDQVTFRDIGLPPPNYVTGPALLIAALDEPDDFDYGVIGSVSRIRVTRCRFENTGTATVGFAIRISSNWLKERAPEAYKHTAEDVVVEDSTFTGNYLWNTIEFAGAGTIRGKALHNYISGPSLGAVDFDKGTRYGLAEYNTVVNCGKPDVYVDNVNTRAGGITIHGSSEAMITYGTTVQYNVVRDCGNPEDKDVYQSLIMIGPFADNTIVSSNEIANTRSAEVGVGVGVLIAQGTHNTTISGNRIAGTRFGIAVSGSSECTIADLAILRNAIDVHELGVGLTCRGDAVETRNVRAEQNTINVRSISGSGITLFHMGERARLEQNRLTGGDQGIYVSSSGVIIASNIIRSAHRGLVIANGGEAVQALRNQIVSALNGMEVQVGSTVPILEGNMIEKQ